MSPHLEQLKKEGEQGRKQINQYTRYGTVILATLQAYGIAVGLEGSGNIVTDPGFFFRATTVITLVGGTVFLMWLGEQITARGIGNGISLIIFAGIVAELAGRDRQHARPWPAGHSGDLHHPRHHRDGRGRDRVHRVHGSGRSGDCWCSIPNDRSATRMYQGESSHLPLKLNTAGVIPPIFASSLLLLPITVAQFSSGQGPDWVNTIVALLGPGQPLFLFLYIGGIVFFTFFYTAIVFNPKDTADNLKKYGGFIPGIRPGERTAEHIDYVLTRITVIGAMYLALVCLLPELIRGNFANVPFYFGGTSLLIVVSVTMDTVAQIQSHLLAHQYEGLVKKAKLRGARR